MNCTTCNTPLEANARFCPKCGTPVSQAQPQATRREPAASFMNEPPTTPPATVFQQNPPQPPVSTQRAMPGVATLSSTDDNYIRRPRRRRRGRGCLLGGLITIIVLLILIVGGWFLIARPYLNNLAQTKLDSALTDAVNHIPPEVAAAPAGPVPISENLLNNLLVLSSSPNDLVKNMQIHITATQMRLEFQVYGFSSAVTGVPQVDHGQLVITNVNIEGIASLILSPDDITALANRHLADAQQRIKHSIVAVNMKNQELDLVLGPQNGGVTLPTLP